MAVSLRHNCNVFCTKSFTLNGDHHSFAKFSNRHVVLNPFELVVDARAANFLVFVFCGPSKWLVGIHSVLIHIADLAVIILQEVALIAK